MLILIVQGLKCYFLKVLRSKKKYLLGSKYDYRKYWGNSINNKSLHYMGVFIFSQFLVYNNAVISIALSLCPIILSVKIVMT